ncbi:MAG: BrnT family toxin [Methylohalobius sp. ZOD2]
MNGITFIWKREKSRRNLAKHGITFGQAAETFFDPFVRIVDASPEEEVRDAALGMDSNGTFFLWFTFSWKEIGSELYLPVKRLELRGSFMKIEKLKQRLNRNRPMTTITIRMPEDVVEDLKRIAPLLGFSGYQPLIRAYIGQGLRKDLEKLDSDTVSALVASLKRRGVTDEVIEEALIEVTHG